MNNRITKTIKLFDLVTLVATDLLLCSSESEVEVISTALESDQALCLPGVDGPRHLRDGVVFDLLLRGGGRARHLREETWL